MTSNAALCVAALATAGVLARGRDGTPFPNQLLLLIAFAALAFAIWRSRRQALHRGLVLGLSGALLVIAVAVPPTESNDVWAYAMYGRIVSHHHASPYKHSAASYPRDPWSSRVDPIWKRTESVYGPVFTAVSAAAMSVVGTSALLGRLFFQCLAALAVALALLLVARRVRDPVALALIGVNPLIVISVVNGAHNDALVGLAVLAAVLLALDRRPVAAGVVLSLAAMVKVIALLPLAAIVVWLWRRDGIRPAAAMGAVAAAVVAVGLLVAGGPSTVKPLTTAQQRFTGSSVWNGPRQAITDHKIDRGLSAERAGRQTRHQVARWSALSVLALGAILAFRRLRDPTPALVAGAVVLAYMLAGSYVYPWYVAWSLPAMVLAWRHRLVWLALAHAAALQLVTLPDPRVRGVVDKLYLMGPEQRFQLDLYRTVMPVVTIILVGVAIYFSVSRSAVEPAFGLVETGPPSGPRVLVGSDGTGAGPAAD